jgi:Response regulator containing a CheY-like receiver domain and an HD-GYP domain
MWLNGEYWLYYDGDTEVVYEKMKNEVTKKMGEIKILIVDDNQANLIALEAVLKSLNYHLIFASSGEDALRYLMKDDFAMILLDVQMPGMDGFETARFIRAREKIRIYPLSLSRQFARARKILYRDITWARLTICLNHSTPKH